MENKALIDFVKNTYGFYRQKYVIMSSGYTKTVNHYFTDKVVESHLTGSYALGVFAGEKVTRFLSVDVDEGGKKAVRLVLDTFERMGIPRERMYVSLSGRKGYHVDIFFSPWLYNNKAKNLYDLMIWQSGLNPKKVEYRPTHKQAVKVPLGVHAVTKKRCWYLDVNTLEPIERMDYIGEIKPIRDSEAYEVVKQWNKKRWNELYADMICNEPQREKGSKQELEFNAEYYERKRISERGTRHNVMVEIACDLRHYGANRFQIGKALRGFYYKQDPAYIETSEKECLEDIEAIAKWAEESVPVWKNRQVCGREMKPVVFTKDDINYILIAPTSAARKVAFLIWSYCKVFGSLHISYESISKIVGCSPATTKTAVSKLIGAGVINRKSGGCHFKNGTLVRESNTYFIPADRNLCAPDGRDVLAESYEFCERISVENINSLYFGMLGTICRPEYLAKFLTKPELAEITKEG